MLECIGSPAVVVVAKTSLQLRSVKVRGLG
jgi:hypothetical protein